MSETPASPPPPPPPSKPAPENVRVNEASQQPKLKDSPEPPKVQFVLGEGYGLCTSVAPDGTFRWLGLSATPEGAVTIPMAMPKHQGERRKFRVLIEFIEP